MGDDDSEMDSDTSDNDDDDDELGGPKMPSPAVAHQSCVNRIRAMPQSPQICASWSESGYVQIWDLSSHLTALAESETEGIQGASKVFNQAPLVTFGGHKVEGYAVDWSPLVQGRLVTGDNKNSILLWEPTSNSKWTVDSTPFL
ncbi:hypothetical protein MLD38_006903 [Melastoma candidum]|uniref:Uncharacterized protein n=1 Tax=Melastoma candidum TaxID=119954 RepID=A0ACB9RT54_9MYRT|nr:hypothetical protein MLD38_006903 [Melastoma candidum]